MKIDRLISIIITLLDKKRVGAKALAEMYEVSLRTIYRDIDAITIAGIPICSTSGINGGFEIMPQYKIDKKVFSANDLSAILMGLSGFSNIVKSKELFNALAKVKSFIPAEHAEEIEFKTNQIFIDLTPWIGNTIIEPNLQSIKTALQNSNIISFEYADRYGNKSLRTVEPYQLVLKSNHWYFQGYCCIREDFRLFRLSRISNLQIKKENFIPRNFRAPQLDFTDTLKTMQKFIKIRIHKSILDNVLDFCPYENFAADGEEHYIVRFPFIENDYYFNILLGFADKCECLAPLNIREELARRILKIFSMYENLV